MRPRTVHFGILVGILAITMGSTVFAQRGQGKGRGGGGWGPGSEYSRLFDPKTIETLEGEVVNIDFHTPLQTSGRGVHLMFKTEKETIAIHLGPEWFIENQDLQLEKKDKIKVTGSRVTYEGKPTLIAAEIQKGDQILELRDKQGFPRWAGWRGPARRAGSGGWGLGSPYNRLYDPKTVQTVEGEVVSIHYHTPRETSGRGVHAMLKTQTEMLEIHLGPEWFLDNQDTQIDAKDKIKVTGSRITYEGKPAVIAAQVVKGADVLELRDKQGNPRWAGWRRGQ